MLSKRDSYIYIKIYDLAFKQKQKTSNPSLYDCLPNFASNSKVTRAFPIQNSVISLLVVISQHKSQSTEENYYFIWHLCINHKPF